MTDFDKNTWQTPKYVFNAMDRKYRFDLDACANADNALCPRFVTESDDITKNATQSAVKFSSRVWMNPPYSNPMPFVQAAIGLMRERDCTVVMLLPADKSTKWYRLALTAATEVIDVIGGRINFTHPITGQEVKGNNKGSMFVIFDPNNQSRVHGSVDLEFLKVRGGYYDWQ
ncbi:phage N-6-adenine-methyltransferase [Aggregatibacter actinomycetemcomitans]|uniref:phage N-6-adenine-methyltransferase n=1 Tax=Aggregatibacter actinomycetemcomitans TaxID=714 RepID=UPI00197C8BE6|nr:phage N-6-adenine-methyltransferase [Aggregatibacter actinomycetemcomitans]MBN6075773.1 phage N-6-adenine-methyltransferase [Aggregatibacter actinomycetemcomitans]